MRFDVIRMNQNPIRVGAQRALGGMVIIVSRCKSIVTDVRVSDVKL